MSQWVKELAAKPVDLDLILSIGGFLWCLHQTQHLALTTHFCLYYAMHIGFYA